MRERQLRRRAAPGAPCRAPARRHRAGRRPADGRATPGGRGSGGCGRCAACSAARAKPVAGGDALDVGPRRLAASRRPPCACAPSDRGRSAPRCVQRSCAGRAVRERQVAALHLARGDRAHQRRHGGERAADHHQARRCPCRAGGRCRRAAAPRSPGRAPAAVEQRARPVAGRRMHDQAGRLVDDEQVLVLVDDGERQRLGAIGAALGGRLQRRPRARWPARTRCAGLVDGAPSTRTQPPSIRLLQVAARELGRQRDERPCRAARRAAPAATANSRRSTAASSPSSPSPSAAAMASSSGRASSTI